MTVEQAFSFSCFFGGNELWDITATLLSEVFHNVSTEPLVQPWLGEQFHYRHCLKVLSLLIC